MVLCRSLCRFCQIMSLPFVMALHAAPPLHGGEGKPASLESILQAWTKREAGTQSFDFSAQGIEFRAKKSFNRLELEMGRGVLPQGAPDGGISVPEKSFSIKLRFAADRN